MHTDAYGRIRWLLVCLAVGMLAMNSIALCLVVAWWHIIWFSTDLSHPRHVSSEGIEESKNLEASITITVWLSTNYPVVNKKKSQLQQDLLKTWQPANLTSSSFIILSDSYLWRLCEGRESSSEKWWQESHRCTTALDVTLNKLWSFQPKKTCGGGNESLIFFAPFQRRCDWNSMKMVLVYTYTRHIFIRHLLHPTPFTPDTFYHRHILTRHLLHQTPFTPDFFTPGTFYTRHLLHQAPFTTNTFYTRHLLHQTPFHQTPFTPNTFYTRQLLHLTTFTLNTVYTRHLLYQAHLHQTPFTPQKTPPRLRQTRQNAAPQAGRPGWIRASDLNAPYQNCLVVQTGAKHSKPAP